MCGLSRNCIYLIGFWFLFSSLSFLPFCNNKHEGERGLPLHSVRSHGVPSHSKHVCVCGQERKPVGLFEGFRYMPVTLKTPKMSIYTVDSVSSALPAVWSFYWMSKSLSVLISLACFVFVCMFVTHLISLHYARCILMCIVQLL